MKECNYDILIIDYLEDNLTPNQRRDFEAHLAGCSSCAAETQKLRKLFGMLAEDPVVAPELNFWREIEERVRSEAVERKPISISKRGFAWWKLAPVLVPALTVLGFLVFHRPNAKTVEIPIAVENVIRDADLDRLMLGRIVDDDLVESMDQVEHYYETELDEVIVEMDSMEQGELIQKIAEQYVGKI
jgi:hypothetical protein